MYPMNTNENAGPAFSRQFASVRGRRLLGLAAAFKLVHLSGEDMTTCKRSMVVGLVFVFVLGGFAQKAKPSPAASAPAQPIKVSVDATHAPEKILHAQLQIPVTGGP